MGAGDEPFSFSGHQNLLILYIGLVTFTKVLPLRLPMVVEDVVEPLLLLLSSVDLQVSSLPDSGMSMR